MSDQDGGPPAAAPPSARRVTIRDIARHAGVSVGTVSHVLNGSAAVRPAPRARVEAAVAALAFVPDRLGRNLRNRRSDMVGVIVPDIGNPFFPDIVRGIEDALYGGGLQAILCNSDNDPIKELSYLDMLRSYRPAGLIVSPAAETAPMAFGDPTGAPPFPVVCIDREPEGWRGDSVVSANRAGARAAAEHLLALGHRRFAVIGGPSALHPAQDRVAGFVERLGEAGLPEDAWEVARGRFDRASGRVGALAALGRRPRPTALFAGNDLMAIGAMAAVRELGLGCPRDVSVIGFDDLEVAELTEPPLTTIAQDRHALGGAAARLLLRRVGGDGSDAERIVLPTTLRVRGSSALPPA